jgi:hypothetical protein
MGLTPTPSFRTVKLGNFSLIWTKTQNNGNANFQMARTNLRARSINNEFLISELDISFAR